MSVLATTEFGSLNEAVEHALDKPWTAGSLGTGADTLEVAEMVQHINTIADGGSAANITTPIGSAIWAALKDPKVGDTFEFMINNLDAGDAKTLVAGASGVTVMGGAAVAAVTSAKFLCYLSAANTVLIYRV